MLIESLAQKTKLALMTVLATIGGCTLICGFTVWCCISLVTKEREQIYILDGDIPFLAQRAQLEANFTMEAKAHIQLFHQYFFNLPPDNDYIKWTVGKAMYMADGTALKQKQALDENGFYSDIISSSAVCTIMCDSIQFDEHERKFTYYGTQLIKGPETLHGHYRLHRISSPYPEQSARSDDYELEDAGEQRFRLLTYRE